MSRTRPYFSPIEEGIINWSNCLGQSFAFLQEIGFLLFLIDGDFGDIGRLNLFVEQQIPVDFLKKAMVFDVFDTPDQVSKTLGQVSAQQVLHQTFEL